MPLPTMSWTPSSLSTSTDADGCHFSANAAQLGASNPLPSALQRVGHPPSGTRGGGHSECARYGRTSLGVSAGSFLNSPPNLTRKLVVTSKLCWNHRGRLRQYTDLGPTRTADQNRRNLLQPLVMHCGQRRQLSADEIRVTQWCAQQPRHLTQWLRDHGSVQQPASHRCHVAPNLPCSKPGFCRGGRGWMSGATVLPIDCTDTIR